MDFMALTIMRNVLVVQKVKLQNDEEKLLLSNIPKADAPGHRWQRTSLSDMPQALTKLQ